MILHHASSRKSVLILEHFPIKLDPLITNMSLVFGIVHLKASKTAFEVWPWRFCNPGGLPKGTRRHPFSLPALPLLCFALVRITMFCHLQDCNVLPSSGLECFAIIRIAMSCHNQDYSVLPSSGLQCFVIVRNTMFRLIQFCNLWPRLHSL